VMLHPFMPFITEELWSKMGARSHELIVAQWPMADARALDPEAAKEIDWLIRLVSEIRTARTELNVPPGARLPIYIDASEELAVRLERNAAAIARLARVEKGPDGVIPTASLQVVVDEATYFIPLEGVIDLEAERARLAKTLAAV